MRRSAIRLAAVVATSGLLLSSCTDGGGITGGGESRQPVLETDGPEVLADSDGTGVEVSAKLFENADTVVVSSPERADQLQAAAVAAELGAPMLTRQEGADEAVDAEISRLGAERVVNVPGDDEAIAQTEPVMADNDRDAVVAIAALEPGQEHELLMPPMMATEQTSLAAVATATAAGADVQVLSVADPRETSESMQVVTEQDTLALGSQFGTSEDYQERVRLAENGELPGGGGLVFPGRRMIALYGHPSGGALGMMGEQPPAEAVERLQGIIEEYQPLEEQPVLPAFEIIVTVASEFPGADGKYTNAGDPEDFVEYIDAITEAGGFAFLDLQPGRASFLEQAQIYEELLKRPNVGLALDAEWNINEDEEPLQRIGSAEAEEINEVADWLATLTRENNLPQKGLILHQFQMQMLRDRDQIDTSHPELAFILHADGHGTPELKFETWNVLRQGLSDDYFMAWKNFEDEDTPMFTPEQTYETVDPRPWFVSYQ